MSIFSALFLLLFSTSHPKSVTHPSRVDPALLEYPSLFSSIRTTGAEFSPEVRALEGSRVRFRAYALFSPCPEGGLFLTRTPEARLHPDDEETLPWDAVAAFFRSRMKTASIPRVPVVEGTLRLGNRRIGDETVILVLEDAVLSRSEPRERPLAYPVVSASHYG